MTPNDNMQTTVEGTLEYNLEYIANAAARVEKNDIVREILEADPMIEILARSVMVALLGCARVDEFAIANNYSTIRGAVKDAIMHDIHVPALNDLAAIVAADRNWTPRKSTAAAE